MKVSNKIAKKQSTSAPSTPACVEIIHLLEACLHTLSRDDVFEPLGGVTEREVFKVCSAVREMIYALRFNTPVPKIDTQHARAIALYNDVMSEIGHDRILQELHEAKSETGRLQQALSLVVKHATECVGDPGVGEEHVRAIAEYCARALSGKVEDILGDESVLELIRRKACLHAELQQLQERVEELEVENRQLQLKASIQRNRPDPDRPSSPALDWIDYITTVTSSSRDQ